MKNKYVDLIEQTFDFPQEEFYVEEDQLHWHDIPLMELIKQYGTPLKVTYLPKISENIQRAKRMVVRVPHYKTGEEQPADVQAANAKTGK